ncbi:MAG: helix-turn-helix transcriptional regulator [Chloroflexi bacterium]|nr:helix-turn-helix transcriptional regulator [Chloroflexota bacterium]
MIQCRLRELIGAKARQERRRITYDDVREQTGVNKNTLTRLANDRAGMVGLSVIDRLCVFFGCQPGDLFVHVKDTDES